jgi:hypothetical protein
MPHVDSKASIASLDNLATLSQVLNVALVIWDFGSPGDRGLIRSASNRSSSSGSWRYASDSSWSPPGAPLVGMASRLLSFAYRRFDGLLPEPGSPDADDQ